MKKELGKILVPVDFSEPSVKAVSYAVNMASLINGEVLLLHVIQTPGIIAEFFKKSDYLVKMTDEIKDKLSVLGNEAMPENKGVKISNRVERGKPYEKILEVSDEINARMIILGDNHQQGGQEQNLGTTVFHVTLKSPVPVLTLKGDIDRMSERIVVPLDLTGQMRKQLFSAMVYGLNYGAEIFLVSSLVGGIKMRESRIYKKIKLAKKTLTENGVKCQAQIFPRSETPPFQNVLSYAKEVNAGLILLLTHKEGYTYDNYIGAFAHHIINKSEVPVLSLTSAATEIDNTSVFKGFVDPAGMLLKG